jgi:hypothetical protein
VGDGEFSRIQGQLALAVGFHLTRGAAEQGIDAGMDLLDVKWLRDVVIAA